MLNHSMRRIGMDFEFYRQCTDGRESLALRKFAADDCLLCGIDHLLKDGLTWKDWKPE
jgi:hypothetical protein